MMPLLRFVRLWPFVLVCGLAACSSFVGDSPSATEPDSHSSRAVRPAGRDAAAPLLSIDPSRGRGSANAPLAIVEFGDYQCPYCRAFHVRTLPRLRAEYIETGKVRYFHMDFPLSRHAHAFPAAVAAYCAGAQGRYARMQDRLYEEQARLGEELYGELATELKLDLARFAACRTSRQARAAVQRDVKQARRLNVHATPTFVLGRLEGERVRVERMATGAPAYEAFAREIDALLP